MRQFTVRLHSVCLNAMRAFRSENKTYGATSKYSCPHCFEMFMWSFQYNKHLRLTYDSQGKPKGDSEALCFRNLSLSWINRDLLRPSVDLLVKRTQRKYINHFFKTLMKITIQLPGGSDSGEKIINFVDSWGSQPPPTKESDDDGD